MEGAKARSGVVVDVLREVNGGKGVAGCESYFAETTADGDDVGIVPKHVSAGVPQGLKDTLGIWSVYQRTEISCSYTRISTSAPSACSSKDVPQTSS